MKENTVGTIMLRCDDHCTILVIDKYYWEHAKEKFEYNFSMQDSDYYNLNGIVGRIKRAFKALFGKPIHFNDIYIGDLQKIEEFRNAFNALVDKNTLN